MTLEEGACSRLMSAIEVAFPMGSVKAEQK